MSLLEQDTTRKGRVYENATRTWRNSKFEAGNDKEYEVEGIRDSTVFAKRPEHRELYSSQDPQPVRLEL